jgi:hypothetical protein
MAVIDLPITRIPDRTEFETHGEVVERVILVDRVEVHCCQVRPA